MEIISRKDARAKNHTIYFTGVPCKNGHISHRYTQSGTCAHCIRASNSPVAASARRLRTADLVPVIIRIYDDDREKVALSVWALAAMRWPDVQPGDIDQGKAPKGKEAGTGLYVFRCHAEDAETVRQIGADSINRRHLDTAAVRQQAFKAAAQMS